MELYFLDFDGFYVVFTKNRINPAFPSITMSFNLKKTDQLCRIPFLLGNLEVMNITNFNNRQFKLVMLV